MALTEESHDAKKPVADQVVNEGLSTAFIPYPPIGENLEEVPIHVRPELYYYVARMGFLPNTLKLYMHIPWIAEHLFRLNNAVMRNERNSLSEHLKYRLSLVASRDNHCTYCTAHHAATLKRRWNYSDEFLEQVLRQEAPADAREAVAVEFVHQASVDAAKVTDDLRARLAKQFNPQEVMELVLLVGFWKMYNTMHTAMDAPIEDPVLGYKCYVDVKPAEPAR